MKFKKYLPYLTSIAIALAVGGLSSLFTIQGLPYYRLQRKPWFAPPEVLFPIVWSILYVLMGIGAAKIRRSASPQKSAALRVYTAQLVVNFFWSVLFFGLHQYLLAFFWLLLLIFLILSMLRAFAAVERTAARLQLPYLLWCAFAAVLNFSVWFLNR